MSAIVVLPYLCIFSFSERADYSTHFRGLQAILREPSNSKSEIEIFGKVVPLNKICDIAVAVT
jgi:hypothetical protein